MRFIELCHSKHCEIVTNLWTMLNSSKYDDGVDVKFYVEYFLSGLIF